MSAPGVEAYSDDIDNCVRVWDNGEVHPDGVVCSPVDSLFDCYHCPGTLFQMIQGVFNGCILHHHSPQ